MSQTTPAPSIGWLHIVFNDDPKRIFLYRKAEVYRAVITEKDIELLIDQASIVITSSQLDLLVPEILDESKTSFLQLERFGISEILYYQEDKSPSEKAKEEPDF
jgi:hypothetical protein